MKVQKFLKPSHRVVEIENVRVGYQVLGEGEPLILVHGLSGSTRWWVRNVQALAQHNRVYLVDLPGFGTMHRMHSRFALIREAQWLVTWMNKYSRTCWNNKREKRIFSNDILPFRQNIVEKLTPVR